MQEKKKSLTESEFYQILDQVIPGEDQIKDHPHRQLYFTRLSMDGLREMHEYSKDERLYEYFEYKPFTTIEETEGYLSKLIKMEGDKPFGRTAIGWFVRLIKDDSLIGTARVVNINYYRKAIEWGYGINPELWGRGYVFEIQEILKEYVFITLQLNRLSGCTMVDNMRTISALTATGVKNEGILRQYYRDYKGNYHDGWIYSLLAEDYPTSKQLSYHNAKSTDYSRKMIANIIASTLNCSDIEENDDMNSIDKWDSLSHISIILAIEKETARRFTMEEIALAKSIEMIYYIINS